VADEPDRRAADAQHRCGEGAARHTTTGLNDVTPSENPPQDFGRIRMTKTSTIWRARAVALVSAALLLGCGGGSGTVEHSIGGTVTGLMAGNSIVLTNGGDSVTVNADGRFSFAEGVGEGSAYRVRLATTTPIAQPCTSTYGIGTMGEANISNVTVICGLPDGPGTFTASGAMGYSRVNHHATLLADGKVLVTAGFNQASMVPPAELYDPVDGSFTQTGTPVAQRLGHTATRLSNGQVLVTGGISWVSGLQIVQASAELYDPATGLWTTVQTMDTERAWHTATLLPDGRVLVAGGRDTLGRALAGAELFDPASGKWEQLRTMDEARWNHTAVLLPNGKVLVSGGTQALILDEHLLGSSELFDPATGRWSTTGRMARLRSEHTATLLPSGQVLVAGGIGGNEGVELYDPTSGSFTVASPLIELRQNHTAVLLPTGQVLVAGGVGAEGTLDSVELYNPATNQWTAGQPMQRPRHGHAATLLGNGKLLISAGSNVHDHLSSTELYH
jgi:hypothetical protein